MAKTTERFWILTVRQHKFVLSSLAGMILTASLMSPSSAATDSSGSLYFNGTNYLRGTSLPVSSPGTGNFTYEFFFNISSFSGADNAGLFSTRVPQYSGYTDGGFDIQVTPAGNVYVSYKGTYIYQSAVGQVNQNQWYHIAVGRNLATWSIFLNGNLLGTQTDAFNLKNNSLVLGALQGSKSEGEVGVYKLNGYISNFRYNNTALYLTNFTPPTSNLTQISGTRILMPTLNDASYLSDSVSSSALLTNYSSVIASPRNPFLAAPAFTISPTAATANAGSAIASYSINSTGGTIASYSISPAISNGLIFNTTTGLISGTPTSQASVVLYTITATNATNSVTATYSLTVAPDPAIAAAARVAETARLATEAEVAKKAKEQKELLELLAIIPSIAGISTNIGDLGNSILLRQKCVKAKTVKYVKKGATCPKGYSKWK